MITRKIRELRKGQTLFSENHRLMVSVDKVDEAGFNFTVLNGLWRGRSEGDTLTMFNVPYPVGNGGVGFRHKKEELAPDRALGFVEVMAVTRDEFSHWYMLNSNYKQVPIRDDAANPDLIAAAAEAEDADPVFEAKIVVTVLGRDTDAAALKSDLAGMTLEQLARAMDTEDLIGRKELVSIEELPADQVGARLRAVSNDGKFFDDDATSFPQGERNSIEDRIEEAQAQTGLDTEELEGLSREFIEKMGLGDAYAAFLEERADHEHVEEPAF